MRRFVLLSVCAALVALLVVPSMVLAQKTFDNKTDIAALLVSAKQHFDPANEDAIVLTQGQSVTRLPDGRFSSLVHWVIWITAPNAVDGCGDVRIPYDDEHCTFTPLAVRTWRDGRWWNSDSTGVVPTLPAALEHAYDYTGMREMMLLVNGIEVPCIVEIAYRIEDRTPFRTNADGLWTFARNYPAAESWFEYASKAGDDVEITASADVPAPATRVDEQSGLKVTRWGMNSVPALPHPEGIDPADTPHLIWSTWGSWRDLGTQVMKAFPTDASLPAALNQEIDSLVRNARTEREKAGKIAEFLGDRVGLIDYPENYWWPNPRTADRVYATSYAHRLDRAIVAAAFFRKAGMTAKPVFIGRGVAPIESEAASLARFGSVQLRVRGAGLDVIYDPGEGEVRATESRLAGYTAWSPSADDTPRLAAPQDGVLDIRIVLERNREKGKLIGSGTLAARGGLSTFDEMSGLESESKDYIESVAKGILKGSSVTDVNPETLEPSTVTVGYGIEVPQKDLDDQGRIALTVGKPKGGIVDHLPAQAQPFRMEQSTVMRLSCLMNQRVETRINLSGLKVIYRPDSVSIANAAGRFEVTSEIRDSQLVVVRSLSLAKMIYLPSDWPALRQLLLAEGLDRNGLVLLKDESLTKQ